MKKTVFLAKDQIEPICDFRYNECIGKRNKIALHSHDYYELNFLEDAPQLHYVNGSSFELPKSALVFVRPNDYHDFYNPTEKTATIHHLGFSIEMGNSLFEFLSPLFPSKNLLKEKYSPYVILNSIDSKKFLKLIFSINTIAIEDKIAKNIAMRSVLTQIFTNFFFRINEETREDIPLWLSDTCTAMNKVPNFSEGMERMIEISGKTKEHLCRSMKKYNNITVSDFINDLRLTFVANRLLNSNTPIIDICYESGFSNLGWMYTQFKKKYGVSPAVFKKQQHVIHP